MVVIRLCNMIVPTARHLFIQEDFEKNAHNHANNIDNIVFSDASRNIAFEDRLKQILDRWIFEASIAFGVGNLRRLKLPVLVFEKTPPNEPKIFERIKLSVNYTMNGKIDNENKA